MKRTKLIFISAFLCGLVFLAACGGEVSEHEESIGMDEAPEQDTDFEDQEADNETENSEQNNDTDGQPDEAAEERDVVLENEAFRVFEPEENAVVGNEFTVRGEARVFEANVLYEFEDGHNILDEGFVTASAGAPEWGEFEITISFDETANDSGTVILYEEDMENGERVNELMIPVTVEE